MTGIHAGAPDVAGRFAKQEDVARLEDRIGKHKKENAARFAGVEGKLDRVIEDVRDVKNDLN